MKRKPWMKWYPADWRADPRLRMCSLAARGLWADLISYMHEGTPYGHLTIESVPPDLHGIAALVGRPLHEVKKALAELEARQVFSHTEDGVIFSRRMVRDQDKADRDHQNGKGGGNPEITKAVKGGVNPPSEEGVKAQRLETRSREPEEESKQAARAPATGFRARIVRAFESANSPNVPDTSRADVWLSQGYDPEICIAVVSELVAKRPSISSLSYFDNPIREAHEKRNPAPTKPAEINWDNLARMYRNTRVWPRTMTAPGYAGCSCPPEILRKHGIDPDTGEITEQPPALGKDPAA